MRTFLKVAAIVVAFAFCFTPLAAFAQLASSAPTTVTVPVGSWVQDSTAIITDILELVLGSLVTVILARLPAAIRTYITAGMIAQVDQLLGRAVQFGLQKAVLAIGSTDLTVDVKSPVIADAVQYAIDHGPEKLVAAMGGAAGIEEKIIARLPLPKASPEAPSPAPTTTAAA